MQNYKKFLAVFIGLLIFAPSVALADHSTAHTIQQLLEQIKALQAQLAALQASEGTPAEWCHTFNTNLKIGDRGEGVEALEQALALEGFDVEHSSNFPSVFDEQLASAVTGFQEKYRDEILTPVGLKYGTGFVGPSTRKKLNSLYGCGAKPPPEPPEIPPLPPFPPLNSIRVIYPNGGEVWQKGTTQRITWTLAPSQTSQGSAGLFPVGLVDIFLFQYQPPCESQPCVLSPTFLYTLAKQTPNDGVFEWTVPKNIQGFNVPDGQYVVRVQRTSTSQYDDSNGPFSIVAVDTSVIPNPQVIFTGSENYIDAFGTPYVRYRLQVTNWASYSDELFRAAPDLPPCGSNANSSRTWVDIFSSFTSTRIYGFCALGKASELTTIWFGIPQGTSPPPTVYITLTDRKDGKTYYSNKVDILGGIIQPSITVLSPKGGETFTKGSIAAATWSGGGKSWIVNIMLQNSAGLTARVLTATPITNDGFENWTVPTDIPAGEYKIRVACANCADVAAGTQWFDDNDAPFSIVAGSTTNSTVNITLTSQPNATLAPRGAVVPFTNFVVSPSAPMYLDRITVERMGLASNQVFKNILLITNSSDPVNTDLVPGRVVAWGVLDSVNNRITLYPNSQVLVTGPTNITIAGLMAQDLTSLAGQVPFLSIVNASFKSTNGEMITATGNFPLTGTGQTVNNTLEVGSFFSAPVPGGINVVASNVENLRLERIIVTNSGGSVKVNGTNYPCTYIISLKGEVCTFSPGITLPKNQTVSIPSQSGQNMNLMSQFDLVSYGQTFSYRAAYRDTNLTRPTITVIFPNGGQQWQVGSNQNVQWSWSGTVSTNLVVSLVNASDGKPVATLLNGVDSRNGEAGSVVKIPLVSAGQYKIQICDSYLANASFICDTSDAPFSIIGTTSAVDLAVTKVELNSTGVTAHFCNLGSQALSSFPVHINLNGILREFDLAGVRSPNVCQTYTWTYSDWSLSYELGKGYNVAVSVDPSNKIAESNESNNLLTATIAGIQGGLVVTSPAGGDQWVIGDKNVIRWNTDTHNQYSHAAYLLTGTCSNLKLDAVIAGSDANCKLVGLIWQDTGKASIYWDKIERGRSTGGGLYNTATFPDPGGYSIGIKDQGIFDQAKRGETAISQAFSLVRPPIADLAVETLTANYSQGVVEVKANMKNLGSGSASNYRLEVFIDDVSKSTRSGLFLGGSSLGAGQSDLQIFSIPYNTGGYHNVRVVATPGGSDYQATNNNLSVYVYVDVPPVQNIPDLTIKSIERFSSSLIPNGVSITLCNNGSASTASFPLKVTANGVTQDFTLSPINLAPGSCSPHAWDYSMWNMQSSGTYLVTATADTNNTIVESNELNNTTSATLTGTASLSLVSPKGSESLVKGRGYQISWTGGASGWTINLFLLDTAKVKTLKNIALSTANDGSEFWTVPSDLSDGNYILRVACQNCAPNTPGWLADSGVFTIGSLGKAPISSNALASTLQAMQALLAQLVALLAR